MTDPAPPSRRAADGNRIDRRRSRAGNPLWRLQGRPAGETRTLVEGDWSISDHADGGQLFSGHLHPTTITRMQLTLVVEVDPLMVSTRRNRSFGPFDPLTRRIEAMEVWDIDFGQTLLTLFFCPGWNQPESW